MINKLPIQIVINIFILSLSKWDTMGLEASNLQKNIIPTHYKLRLFTKRDNFLSDSKDSEYKGKIEIFIKPTEENVTSITLNSDLNIVIEDSTLYYLYGSTSKFKLENGEYSNKSQTLKFKLQEPLPMKKSKLLISYKNKYHRWDKGFLRLRIKKDKSYVLVTNAVPDNARMIFPCLDDPNYKASFKISVYIHKSIVAMGYQPLTNTELSQIKLGKHTDIYMFKRTSIPMSSYLAAVVIAKHNHTLPLKFSSSYPELDKGLLKELKIWGEPKMLETETVKKFQNDTEEIINFFTNKFKIGYAFKKLDQVFVRRFPFQGMENFGLIFYKAEAIESSGLEYVRYLLAHELAHQWFGNLVTAKDWANDFWIQEGAAHYFATKILDEIKFDEKPFGYYEYSKKFFANEIWPTFNYDSLNLAPPLTETVERIFGKGYARVLYRKAAIMIRMLKLTYGSDIFDKAMEYYFTNFRENNAGTGDFLYCFELAIQLLKPNSTIKKPSEIGFENWIKYQGYPVVKVSKDPNQPNTYILNQERFTFIKKTKETAQNYSWYLPITYSTSENPNFNKTEAMLWLSPNETAKITLPNKVDWIILNNQVAGYYRVNYDTENWKEIIKILNDKNRFREIHEYNRMQLLQDSLSLSLRKDVKYLDTHLAKELVNYLEHEDEYYLWKSVVESIEMFGKILCGSGMDGEESRTCQIILKIAFLQSPVTKKYLEFKNNPSSNLTNNEIKLKDLVNQIYCKFFADEEEPCNKIQIKKFQDDLKSGNTKNLNFSDSNEICCEAIKTSDEELWNKLWAVLKDSPFKKEIISCLACSTNTAIINKYLEKIADGKLAITDSERTKIFLSISSSNLQNARLAFNFLAKSYQQIEQAYSSNMPFNEYFESLGSILGSDEDIIEMENFLKAVNGMEDLISEEIGRSASKALDRIKINNVMYFKRFHFKEGTAGLEIPTIDQPKEVSSTQEKTLVLQTGHPTEVASADQTKENATIDHPKEVPPTDHSNDVPSTDQQKEVPSTDQHKDVPSTDQPKDLPSTDHPKDVPSTDQPKDVPSTDHPKDVPSTDQPKDVPSSDQQKEIPSTDQPKDVPLTDHLKEVPSTDQPKDVPSTDQAKDVPSADHAKDVPSTDQPKEVPPTDQQKEVASTDHSKDVPPTDQPKEVPSTDQAKDVPSADHAKDVPSTDQPKEVPPTDQQKEVASTDHSKDVPSTDQPKEVPSTDQSKDVPSTDQPKDVPSTDQAKDVPSADHAKDLPSTDQPKEVPPTDQQKEVASTDHSKDVPSTDQSKDVPSSDQQKEIPSTDQPKDVPPTDQQKEVASTDHSKDVPSTDQPKDVPSSDQQKEIPSTDQPKDVPPTDQQKEVASTNHSKDVPSTDQPKDVPSTDQLKDVPSSDQQKEVLSTDQPKEVPSTDQPKHVPSTDQPKDVPSTDQQNKVASSDHSKDVPSTDHSKDVASTDQPKDVPSTDHSKDVPSTDHPKDVPSTDQQKEVASTDNSKDIPSTDHSKEVPLTDQPKDVPSTDEQKEVPSNDHSKEVSSTDILKEVLSTEHKEEVASSDHSKEIPKNPSPS